MRDQYVRTLTAPPERSACIRRDDGRRDITETCDRYHEYLIACPHSRDSPRKHLVLFTCSKFTRTRGREVYLEHVIALTVRKIKYFWHCDYYNKYSSGYNSRLRLSHNNYTHELYAIRVPRNYNHMPWVSLYLPLMDSHCLLWEAKFRVGRARKQSCSLCARRIFKDKTMSPQ